MRILVTGGAGYIGSHTCVEMLNKGYEVVIIDNLDNSNIESINRVQKITGKEIKFYEADVRDRAALDKIFEENEIDADEMITVDDTEVIISYNNFAAYTLDGEEIVNCRDIPPMPREGVKAILEARIQAYWANN